ncbi:MAG: VanZ family protein [Bacillota bacterium]|nr:VanZ family protein [Bacillota bacterium]MDW7685082.1 VanZ family protein [Bacillota bacterium]
MYRVNILPIGIILLIVYISLDLIKNRGKRIAKRLIFYSFVFYLFNVFQVTTGGIHVPPDSNFQSGFSPQLVPFRFIADWFALYQRQGAGWFFWNSVKLSAYNFIMLFPLGVYLPLLYKLNKWKKAALYLFLTSLTIEVYQIIFSYFGLTMFRQFNVDDILLNTLGGLFGYYAFQGLRSLLVRVIPGQARGGETYD